MANQYIPQRKRVYEKLKLYFSNKFFSAEKDFFINNLCIELGVKESLIIESIEVFKKAGFILEQDELLKSAKYQEEVIKTDVEKQAEKEVEELLMKNNETQNN